MKNINFNSLERVLSFTNFQNCKELTLPEVCFAGRSNSGKSSLINSLLNRKKIARTSKIPGQTKTIVFYRIDKYFSLVDVPGYGYAGISKKKIVEVSALLKNYFLKSKNLKKVYVLLDSRHGIKDIDLDFLLFLEKSNLSYNCIFTKSDKLTKDTKKEFINDLCEEDFFKGSLPIFTSSKTKEGIKELKGNILKVIENNEKSF